MTIELTCAGTFLFLGRLKPNYPRKGSCAPPGRLVLDRRPRFDSKTGKPQVRAR